MAFALISNNNFQLISIIMQTRSKKGMSKDHEQTVNAIQSALSEQNPAREHNAKETGRGQTRRAATGRTLGSATKDARHGLNTDHGTSRQSESRRQGSIGSESKGKRMRKSI